MSVPLGTGTVQRLGGGRAGSTSWLPDVGGRKESTKPPWFLAWCLGVLWRSQFLGNEDSVLGVGFPGKDAQGQWGFEGEKSCLPTRVRGWSALVGSLRPWQ